MTPEEMIEENNAMLKVKLKNQALLMVLFDDVIGKLNEDYTYDAVMIERMFKLRENEAVARYNLFMADIRVHIVKRRENR